MLGVSILAKEMTIQPVHKRYCLLLAEDDPDDRKIIANTLSATIPDAEMTFVANGREVIEFLENAARLPDVLVMDIQMPIMTGLEALHYIRNTLSLKDLPVVILSTSSEAGDIRKSEELGALYISKPLSLKEWLSQMERIRQLLPNGTLASAGG